MIKNMSCVLLMMVCASVAFAGGDKAAGKALFDKVCVECHDTNGHGLKDKNAPAIAGQEEWYLIRQMEAYKNGIRGTHPKDVYGKEMADKALATLKDGNNIANLAAYVTTMAPLKPKSTMDGDPKRGKALYMVCATCHGQNGEGMQAMGGAKVYTQQDWYLARQLQYFKDGVRGTNPKDVFGMQMRPMAMTLQNEQAIKDVVAYMMTLGK